MNTPVWDAKSQLDTLKETPVFDCMIAEFLLSEGRYVPTEADTLVRYKVKTLQELAEKQQAKFATLPKLYSLYNDIEMPMTQVLWHMEQRGIALDASLLTTVGKEIDTAIKTYEEELKKEFGSEMNLNSSVQIGNFLAEKMYVPLSKTKTGRYATNESELTQHAEKFPIIQKLLSYRELAKLRSTYVDSLISKVDESGRIHTTYSLIAASTGRLSSSNPNLQNIPVTSEFGQKIKSCFVAGDGNVLVSFDYSQQELRVLAHLTGEDRLIEAFQKKLDVHTTTASQLFLVDYEHVTKEQRMIAKTVNFGIIYGMSSYGMSSGLNIPVEEAQRFIDTFYATYPKIKTYYDHYLKDAKTNGFVETLLGRRRYVFEYPTQKFIDNAMRRVLINFPIQGTAADLMKKAMITIHNEIVEKDSSCTMLLQIHDDLVFEMKDDREYLSKRIDTIRTILCTIYPLVVPVEVDVKVGKRWGGMEKWNSGK